MGVFDSHFSFHIQMNKSKNNISKSANLIILLCQLLNAGSCFAGADATFDETAIKLRDWSEGSLGTSLGLGSLTIGIVTGIIRNSLMPAALGMGGVIIKHYLPAVIDSALTAVV